MTFSQKYMTLYTYHLPIIRIIILTGVNLSYRFANTLGDLIPTAQGRWWPGKDIHSKNHK